MNTKRTSHSTAKSTAKATAKCKPSLEAKKRPLSKSAQATTKESANTAQVYDFVGAAMLLLPKELKDLLGQDLLRSNALEADLSEVLLIVREPGVAAYVHLPMIAMEMDGTALDLADGKVTLKAVNGPWDKRIKRKARAHDLVTLVQTDPTGGQDD